MSSSGSWKYTHPEGVLVGLTLHDWAQWPLKRYGQCLDSEDKLDQCMAEATKDLRAKYGDNLETFDSQDPGGHKYALRWNGLKLLEEVRDDDKEIDAMG
jgi:hypothetical protein